MAASVNNYIFSVNSVDCWRQSSSKLWLCIEHLGTMSVTTAAEYRSGQYRQSPATFTERRKDHKCLNDKHRSLEGSAASENSVSGEGSHIQTWHWVKHFGKRVAFPCKSTRKLLESLMQVLVQRVMISLPCQHGHDSGDCSELSVGDLCPLLEMLVGWAGGRERERGRRFKKRLWEVEWCSLVVQMGQVKRGRMTSNLGWMDGDVTFQE